MYIIFQLVSWRKKHKAVSIVDDTDDTAHDSVKIKRPNFDPYIGISDKEKEMLNELCTSGLKFRGKEFNYFINSLPLIYSNTAINIESKLLEGIIDFITKEQKSWGNIMQKMIKDKYLDIVKKFDDYIKAAKM